MDLYRWVAKYVVLVRILLAIFICGGFLAIGIWQNISVQTVGTTEVMLVFFIFVYTVWCQDKVMKKASNENDTFCDPYPLLNDTEMLLNSGVKGMMKQVAQINHCVALRCTGQYEKTYEILKGINIDKEAGIIPLNKAVYYNNLTDICTLIGKYDEADVWNGKLMQIYGDLRNTSQKRALEPVIINARANDALRKKEYSQVIIFIDSIKDLYKANSKLPRENMRTMIDNAMLKAKAYIGMNDNQNARKQLDFIVRNGYKLHTVTVAKEMLDKLKG